ncbi:hypothetical protein CKM354_000505800 [Cercospora kikuchii]|uniref:Uncharacterized protein n=1 Tax=Cercospora kikuchii TaxID=84275 RepID=A0A9P3FC31_9PEZI|nr:uncharacterized protein CKM354_000505800 [Cercospora kikuchii]GIZ41763.1 hypothetical protein CKM354_000505800 [Cercospora kikuchii]
MSSPDKQDSSFQPGLDESVGLSERIQDLPQELQDEIFNLTVAIEPAEVAINKSYKPPWQLRIDRASRKKMTQQYYSTTIFVAEDVCVPRILQSWLNSLPTHHSHLISEIRLLSTGEFTPRLHAHYNVISVAHLRIWLSLYRKDMKANFGLEEGIFKTKVLEADSQGNERVLWVSYPETQEYSGYV